MHDGKNRATEVVEQCNVRGDVVYRFEDDNNLYLWFQTDVKLNVWCDS